MPSTCIPRPKWSVAQCTLQVHCNPSSVAVQSVHCPCSTLHSINTILLYTAYTLQDIMHVGTLCIAGGTLNMLFSRCRVVAVYTEQSMQSMCSHTLLVHCTYTAYRFHFGLGLWSCKRPTAGYKMLIAVCERPVLTQKRSRCSVLCTSLWKRSPVLPNPGLK